MQFVLIPLVTQRTHLNSRTIPPSLVTLNAVDVAEQVENATHNSFAHACSTVKLSTLRLSPSSTSGRSIGLANSFLDRALKLKWMQHGANQKSQTMAYCGI